jgi:hypothetical protein
MIVCLPRRVNRFLAILVAAIVLFCPGCGVAPVTAQTTAPQAVDARSLPDVPEKVTPAVVNIAATSQAPDETNPLFNDPYFRRFFDLPQMPKQRPRMSAGSGVIASSQAMTTTDTDARPSSHAFTSEGGCPSSSARSSADQRNVKAHRPLPAPNLELISPNKKPALTPDAQIVLSQEPPGSSASRREQQRSRRHSLRMRSRCRQLHHANLRRKESHASHPL